MRRLVAAGLATLAAWAAASWPTALRGVAAQPDERTIWDGVYTARQAERGQATYNKRCGFCHRGDLSGGEVGGEVAPALGGPTFPIRWRGALSGLYLKIADDMPEDDPGTLSDGEVADVVSYVLKANGAPAGGTELPADAAALDAIRVVRKP
jgi:S-disulfanyl-L-cysteine oxidoreductase SoxD